MKIPSTILFQLNQAKRIYLLLYKRETTIGRNKNLQNGFRKIEWKQVGRANVEHSFKLKIEGEKKNEHPSPLTYVVIQEPRQGVNLLEEHGTSFPGLESHLTQQRGI